MTTAMETLTAAINEAEAPAEVASAVGAFSDQIETLVPALKKLEADHPEWETDPPSELQETMDRFKSASSAFQGAMPRLMQMANQHADDAQLQGALQKFQSVVAGL